PGGHQAQACSPRAQLLGNAHARRTHSVSKVETNDWCACAPAPVFSSRLAHRISILVRLTGVAFAPGGSVFFLRATIPIERRQCTPSSGRRCSLAFQQPSQPYYSPSAAATPPAQHPSVLPTQSLHSQEPAPRFAARAASEQALPLPAPPVRISTSMSRRI